jgi:hypothetical protein
MCAHGHVMRSYIKLHVVRECNTAKVNDYHVKTPSISTHANDNMETYMLHAQTSSAHAHTHFHALACTRAPATTSV